MEIVLVSLGLVRPCTTRKDTSPVGWRLACSVLVVLRITPDVPVAIGVGFGLPALLEPVVLNAGVIDDEIHNDTQPSGVCLRNEPIHVLYRPILRVDLLVVAYIVSHVIIRRIIDRTDPDEIYA